MSAISESATIDVMLADYAAFDSSGVKANILGIGGNILPITPTGLTARFSLVTQIHVPAEACPAETSLEISLRGESGDLFNLPGQPPQAVRYATILTIAANPGTVGLEQTKHIGAMSINVVDFGNGMPLPPGDYAWHVSLDGDEDHAVDFRFCVPKPVPTPVIG